MCSRKKTADSAVTLAYFCVAIMLRCALYGIARAGIDIPAPYRVIDIPAPYRVSIARAGIDIPAPYRVLWLMHQPRGCALARFGSRREGTRPPGAFEGSACNGAVLLGGEGRESGG